MAPTTSRVIGKSAKVKDIFHLSSEVGEVSGVATLGVTLSGRKKTSSPESSSSALSDSSPRSIGLVGCLVFALKLQ